LEPALAYIQEVFQKTAPPNKQIHIELISASYRRDVKCAFENVKSVLYGQKRKVLLEKVRKIRAQQRGIQAEKLKKQQGCCGSKKSSSSMKTLSLDAPKDEEE